MFKFWACASPWSASAPANISNIDVYANARGPCAAFFVDLLMELGGRKMLLEFAIQQLNATEERSASKQTRELATASAKTKGEQLTKITDLAAMLVLLSNQTELQWLHPTVRTYTPSELRKFGMADLINVALRTTSQLKAQPAPVLEAFCERELSSIESTAVDAAAAATTTTTTTDNTNNSDTT